MDSCPRARKALDAEWEKLRFLKRPIPLKALVPGMREASERRRLSEKKLGRRARQFTLAELSNFATKKRK